MKQFEIPKYHSAQVRALQQSPDHENDIFEHIHEYHDVMLFDVSEKNSEQLTILK